MRFGAAEQIATARIERLAAAGFPRAIFEFQCRLTDDSSGAACVVAARWLDGFRYPPCGHDKRWERSTMPFTWEDGCCPQALVTAGTMMHGSKLMITIRFWTSYLIAARSNGTSAPRWLRKFGLGLSKTACLRCARFCRAMLVPDRNPLAEIVEVNETVIPCRTSKYSVAGSGGRGGGTKMLVAGAVEVMDYLPGRARLAVITDFSATSLDASVTAKLDQGAIAKAHGWPGHSDVPDVSHDPHTLGAMATHILLL